MKNINIVSSIWYYIFWNYLTNYHLKKHTLLWDALYHISCQWRKSWHKEIFVNIQSALNNNNTTNNENDNNNNMMKSTLLLMLATKALCQHTDILTQFVIDFFPDTPDLLESYRYYGRMIKEDKSELTCNCQCSSGKHV